MMDPGSNLPLSAVSGSPSSAGKPEVRARLLGAARRRFEQVGYRATSVADITREAGVAAGTLYRYFRDKEHLFVEVMREQNQIWLADVRQALDEQPNALARLARIGQASAEFHQRRGLLTAVLRRDPDLCFAPLIEAMRAEVIESTVGLLAEVIRDGIAEGVIRDLDPERVAFFLFSAGSALFNERRYPYDEMRELLGDICIRGLLPRAGRADGDPSR